MGTELGRESAFMCQRTKKQVYNRQHICTWKCVCSCACKPRHTKKAGWRYLGASCGGTMLNHCSGRNMSPGFEPCKRFTRTLHTLENGARLFCCLHMSTLAHTHNPYRRELLFAVPSDAFRDIPPPPTASGAMIQYLEPHPCTRRRVDQEPPV